MRKPVLIFDFGNVIGFFDYLRTCEHFGAILGLTSEAVRDQLVDGGFAELLARFESGRLAPDVFATRVMEIAGLRLDYDDFVGGWEDIFWPNEPVARLIAFLKSRGYSLYLGSNTNVLHATHYRRQFAETLDLFDGFVLSYEVGHLKPARDFFDACVRAAGVAASECVFIDDIAENVEGARRAGLAALQYLDTPTLITELRQMEIEVIGIDSRTDLDPTAPPP
jgi:glucose-1-phosphatase